MLGLTQNPIMILVALKAILLIFLLLYLQIGRVKSGSPLRGVLNKGGLRFFFIVTTPPSRRFNQVENEPRGAGGLLDYSRFT